MKKRILSMLLAIVMVVGMLPTTVLATDYTGWNSDTAYATDDVITIDGKAYTYKGDVGNGMSITSAPTSAEIYRAGNGYVTAEVTAQPVTDGETTTNGMVTVTLNNATINTVVGWYGILFDANAYNLTVTGAERTTNTISSYRIGVKSENGSVTLSDVSVTITGSTYDGVRAECGDVNISGLNGTITGSRYGVCSATGSVTIDNASVNVTGTGSHGVNANKDVTISRSASIITGGHGGVKSENGSVTLTNNSIMTVTGNTTSGVWAKENVTVSGSNGTVTGSQCGVASNEAVSLINNSSMTITGNTLDGIQARLVTINGSVATITGYRYGVLGSVTLSDASVTITAEDKKSVNETLTLKYTDTYKWQSAENGAYTFGGLGNSYSGKYLHIEPANSATVTWSNGDSGSYEQKVAVGATITVPTSEEFEKTMHKDGYEITGWTSSDPTYKVGDTMPAENLTFTAEYTATLTGTVTISGTAEVGQTLTATVTDTNNTGELSYQWYRNMNQYTADDPISGATSSTYELQNDDICRRIYCVVTSNIQVGSIESAMTNYVPALTFAEGDISISDYYGTYDGQYHGINARIPDGAALYFVGDAPYDGKYKDAGTYNVEYVVSHPYYEGVSGSAVIQIDKVYLDVTANTLYAEVGDDCPPPTYTITGFVNDETAETAGITGTPTLTYSETPDMSKTGTYFINVDTSGMSAANYEFNGVYGILTVLEHVHNFTGYTVEGDTIYGACSESDCPKGGTVKLLTIAAPTNAVYEQGLYHNASLFGYDPQVELDAESVIYTKNGVETDPVDAGIYTASYTYEGVTASVTYEVAKRPLTITADDETIYVGNSAPEYTYTVSGWSSNHDAEDEFSHKVSGITAVCENVNLNRVGTYAITISGTPVVLDSEGNDVSANYELTTQNGTLTVKTYYIPIITPTYPPVVDEGDNGDVTVSPKNPQKGDTVIITPDPDAGYEVDEVIVTDKNGSPVEVIDNGDGTYSFVQPGGKVNIEVTFKEIEKVCPGDSTCPMYPYSDLDASLWYHDGIHYCIENGLMQGIGNNQFAPNSTTTRAMIVTILWRLEGKPTVDNAMSFEDVESDKWYTEAVRWAQANGIVSGYSDKAFGPNDIITREQLATILYRYEQYKGGGFAGAWMIRMDFTDLADVSDWAYEAMCWMNMNGIVNGKPGKVLDPKGSATRAEAASMLQRYCELSDEGN